MKNATLKSYVAGFGLSILLTLGAYFLANAHVQSGHLWPSSHQLLVAWLVGLALVQFVVQLIFFLHLGRETKPRWNLLVFGFMGLVVAILVFGSLWIMNNLNYNMMPPADTNTYMEHEEGIHK